MTAKESASVLEIVLGGAIWDLTADAMAGLPCGADDENGAVLRGLW